MNIIKLLILLMTINLNGNSPEWAKNAIWYQIFTERFYNGDVSNDPTKESLVGTWPWEVQQEWRVSPWTSDWYQFQSWEKNNGQDFRYQFQIRRYGGDLQGVIDKLDYLESLGINALYFNPLFDSPSSHKYGAAYYHHIDRHFGPDPQADTKLIQSEDPNDPATWRWTHADRLFLELIQKAHEKNIKIIIDGVFNHVGLTFWAFQDVIKHRDKSPYYDWFVIQGSSLNDQGHANEFQDLPPLYTIEFGAMKYKGWVADLPAFRQDKQGPVAPVRNHIHEVLKRWMDPNNDGDPSDGIDGWRLDVAERIQLGFWDLFGQWVREINPHGYITGEIWWKDYMINKQFNAEPWLGNNKFDAVMNYRFGDAMFKFFIDENNQISATKLNGLLNGILKDYGLERTLVLQNVLDSHDMERLASAVVNPDRWMDHANNTWYNREFDIRKPNAFEKQIQKTIITFQFMFPGAPYIYYGDEAGMWGADDPDCRKPMIWKEFKFENESAHHCDHLLDCQGSRPIDLVEFDEDLFKHYQTLIRLRKQYKCLTHGDFKVHYKNDRQGVYIFERRFEQERVLAMFNGSNSDIEINEKFFPDNSQSWNSIFGVQSNILKGKDAKIFLHN